MRAGADSAIGAARNYKGTMKERLERVLAEEVKPELIVVHRDSDSKSANARYDEINSAASELGCGDEVVAVVPIQETEAWLLTDDSAIRSVVGRPKGRAALNLPALKHIESTANPKELLQEAFLIASEATGARRKKMAKQFQKHRATLLERLDPDGPVVELSSWQRFVTDLSDSTVAALEKNS
ncbi:DUF4276 family protein [Gordonia sp. ABSL49_1]|uniref:DUF4276 family protein n=1 Tax=Gordonia sp. ABSL49_1 TaxID=2920941 RepID=UPI001F0DD96C|nr:DUF4276 family protein [Gordonia sp. ABSL49_1]